MILTLLFGPFLAALAFNVVLYYALPRHLRPGCDEHSDGPSR